MHTVILGGKTWAIAEPVFKDLKNILACLNRLNNPASDAQLIHDVQLILVSLLGERHVKKFQRFGWEAWKIPTPNPEELAALFAAIPKICGLQTATATQSTTTTDKANDWDALYWRVIRVTGWTWDTVDTTMTMSRLTAMQEHLNFSPSVDSLAAGYLGYEYSKPETLENTIDKWLNSQGLDHAVH